MSAGTGGAGTRSLAVVACVEHAAFMYAPIVQTVMRGMIALGPATDAAALTPRAEHHTLANESTWLPRTLSGPLDIFVWVGPAEAPILDLLGRLTSRGVFTVLYNADELDRPRNKYDSGDGFRDCATLLQSIRVVQVWDFSFGNIVHCRTLLQPDIEHSVRAIISGQGDHETDDSIRTLLMTSIATASKHRHRYVPPGYVSRSQPASLQYSSKPKLIFFGGAHRWYPRRIECLQFIRHRLVQMLNFSTEAISRRCYERWCDPTMLECANLTCPLTVVHTAQSESQWDAHVRNNRGGLFLNVDKACNRSGERWKPTPAVWADNSHVATSYSRSCNTFRFSALLSAGARVFSERCHPADEHFYKGLVEFASIDQIPKAVLTAWRSSRNSAHADDEASKRIAEFDKLFSPSRILERAGVFDAIRQHRATHTPLNRQSLASVRSGSGSTVPSNLT